MFFKPLLYGPARRERKVLLCIELLQVMKNIPRSLCTQLIPATAELKNITLKNINVTAASQNWWISVF